MNAFGFRRLGVQFPSRFFHWGVRAAKRHQLVALILASGIADLIILRTILQIPLFQSADFVVPVFTRPELSLIAFSAWNYQNFGSPNGTSLFLIFFGGVAVATHDPSLAEKLVYFPAPLASSIAAFWFFTRLKLRSPYPLVFSFGYQFSPWFIGQFMSGEPSMVWIYALLPLYLATLWLTIESPHRLVLWLLLSTVCAFAIFFTLQAVIVYAAFSVPFVLILPKGSRPKRMIGILGGWVACWIVGLIANLTALYPYFAYLGVVQSSSLSPFVRFGIELAPFVELRLWLLVIVGVTALATALLWERIQKELRVLVAGFLLVEICFSAIYAAIPGASAQALFTDLPVLAPFLDFDKFLLIAWGCTFFTLALIVGRGVLEQSPATASVSRGSIRNLAIRIGRPFHLAPAKGKKTYLFAIGSMVAILALASVFSNVPSTPATYNGASYAASEFSFNSRTVPDGYFELQNFLLDNGGSYGLGFKTLLFPQNPGNIIPYYVGRYLIPGFVPPSAPLKEITNQIIDNQTAALENMALLGIRYLAVMPSPANSWWPQLAQGPLSVGDLGPIGVDGEGWFPQGNSSMYLGTFNSWPGLEIVYQSSDLTVYLNPDYQGYGYSYPRGSPVDNLTEGTGLGFINTSPLGGNVVRNGNLTATSDWNFSSSGEATFLPNGTLEVDRTSSGAGAFQAIVLHSSSTYDVSFDARLTPGIPASPPEGSAPTYLAILWNQYTGSSVTGGVTFVLNDSQAEGATQVHTFTTPAGNASIRAIISVNVQAPSNQPAEFGTYSNISVTPINGSDTFAQEIRPCNVNSTGYAQFTVKCAPSVGGTLVTFPMLYNPAWVATYSNGTVVNASPGLEGLLTFALNNSSGSFTLSYQGQSGYDTLFVSDLALIIALPVVTAGLFLAERLRRSNKD
jgi:hypothetical protein